MGKISIDKDDLLSLYKIALKNGTLEEFGDLLSEWLDQATNEIASLRTENERQRLLLREFSQRQMNRLPPKASRTL